jgi:sugar transferase (PEP-CTERM system associated)
VIRVFNLYIPTRSVILVAGEMATICLSFLLAIIVRFGFETNRAMSEGRAVWTILGVIVLAFVLCHFAELYDSRRVAQPEEAYPRLLALVGCLSFALGALGFLLPEFLVGRNALFLGLCILAIGWTFWRWAYGRLIFHPALRERVYLLGNSERAKQIAEAIRTNSEFGMDLVDWACEAGSDGLTCESIGSTLRQLRNRRAIDRVIVALKDRRSMMPVGELLELRLDGIHIEDGTNLIEKLTGRIEVDELHPSWMIFGQGFRFRPWQLFARRTVSVVLALTLGVLVLPLLPIITLLIKTESKGPILYRQKRVGVRGSIFECLKFRTMRQDAEDITGPTWASDEDPRVTKVGKLLRRTRLDELPQVWNVLCGDMNFVGPRPERPEFVEQLAEQIPYYHIRHAARPGITGWAQVNYGYGSSVDQAKEKLRYDLYYIRNASVMLDFIIAFRTLRAVVIGRGVR